MHLLVDNLPAAGPGHFFSGIVASPESSLGFHYMLEPFPPAKKMNIGLCLALTNMTFGVPVARLIAPDLLQICWRCWYLQYVPQAFSHVGLINAASALATAADH